MSDTQYRILEETVDGKTTFYPQYKGWFFWNTFGEYDCDFEHYTDVYFKTLKDARDFLDSKQQNFIKIHEYP